MLNADILLGQALSVLKAARRRAEVRYSSWPSAVGFESWTPSLILAKLALEVADHAAVMCAILNTLQLLMEDGVGSK